MSANRRVDELSPSLYTARVDVCEKLYWFRQKTSILNYLINTVVLLREDCTKLL